MTTQPDPGVEVAMRVVRRGEVAKMARVLKDRLALASYKRKRGWEQLRLDDFEPRVDQERTGLKRKHATFDAILERDLDPPDRRVHGTYKPRRTHARSHQEPQTSPIRERGRSFPAPTVAPAGIGLGLHRPVRAQRASATTMTDGPVIRQPLVQARQLSLSQSSPVYHRKHRNFPVSHGANLVFGSDPPGPDLDLPSPDLLTDGEEDVGQLHRPGVRRSVARGVRSSPLRSSPPRTPSPRRTRHRPGRARDDRQPPGHEGADLLLYLHNTPPSNPLGDGRRRPPMTPPSRHLAPPLAGMMLTPTGTNFMAALGPPDTPGAHINWADFVHDSPVPTQTTPRLRTPGMLTQTPRPTQSHGFRRTPRTPIPARTPATMSHPQPQQPQPPHQQHQQPSRPRVQTPPGRVRTPLAAREARKTLFEMGPPGLGTPRGMEELGGALPR